MPNKVVFITALPLEFQAVKSFLKHCKEEIHPKGTVYEKGWFNDWQVGLAEIGQGNSLAAGETQKAIDFFEPNYIFFVGIAGGIKDVNLGDVVVANVMKGYEKGKETNSGFLPRTEVGMCSHTLVERAKATSRNLDWFNKLNSNITNIEPKSIIGVIAAGEKVVASENNTTYERLTSLYSDALAVEMEGIGFLTATHANNGKGIVIRGISDLLSNKKESDDSGWQEKAAHHAAAFAFEMLEKLASTPDPKTALSNPHSNSSENIKPSSDTSSPKNILSLESSLDESPATIAIVGSGFAGIVTAIRILQFAKQKLNLVIIHDKVEQQYGGLAYSHFALIPDHLLNIQAGRLSLFREAPFDFMQWANYEAIGVKEEKWHEGDYTEYTAVSRNVYKQYLAERFEQACGKHQNIVKVEEIYGSVFDIDVYSKIAIIQYTDETGKPSSMNADQVILATGHGQPIIPHFASLETLEHSRFFSSPFDKKIFEELKNLSTEQKICIIGTGLTAYDAVLTIDDSGFDGQVSLVSRNALTHKTYPNKHSHDSIPVPTLEINKNLNADELETSFLSAFSKTRKFLTIYHGIQNYAVNIERTLKAMEPWVQKLMSFSNDEEIKMFYHKNRSRLTTTRAGVVYEVGNKIDKLRNKKKGLRLIIDNLNIDSIDVCYKNDKSYFRVISRKENKLEISDFDLIITCMGWEADFNKIDSVLWQRLIKKRIAQPHTKTAAGIEINQNGYLIGIEGTISTTILAVGSMRQGDELIRNGRVGAFIYSIGTIRNQAVFAAQSAIQHLDLRLLIGANESFYKKVLELVENILENDNQVKDKYKKLCEKIKDIQFQPQHNDFHNLYKKTIFELENSDLINFIYEKLYYDFLEREVPQASKEQIQPYLSQIVIHKAQLQAAKQITDISHIASGYAKVRKFIDRNSSSFRYQQAMCVEYVKRAVIQLNAISGSLLVYRPNEKKSLKPFSRYKRIEKFTRTKFGEAINGNLLKYYSQPSEFPKDKQIKLYLSNDRISCLTINNYNELSDQYKKNIYDEKLRQYPSVIVAPIVSVGEPVGIIYLEAELARKFDESDANLLLEFINRSKDLTEIVNNATTNWDGDVDNDRRDEDFSNADLSESDLQNHNFTNANLENASFENTELQDATFDAANCINTNFRAAMMANSSLISTCLIDADFNKADLHGAKLVNANLTRANLSFANLDGATIKLADFTNSTLCGVVLHSMSVKQSNFSNVNFKDAKLEQLQDVELAIWDNAKFDNTIFDRETFNSLPSHVRNKNKHCVKFTN